MGVLRRWPVVLLVLLWLFPGSPARAAAAHGERVSREDAVGIVADRRDGLAQADGEDTHEQPCLPPVAIRVRPGVEAWAPGVSPQPLVRARARGFVVGIPRGPPRSV